MIPRNRAVRGAGVVVFAGLVAGLLSVAPSLDSDNYLAEAALASNQVKIGAIAQFLMSLLYLGFAILLFPIIRRYGETLAVGFLGFRILAVGIASISTVIMLSLLSLSQSSTGLSLAGNVEIMVLGDVLRDARDQMNHVFMIWALSVGNGMFYLLTLRSGLLPRWLSVWGLAGAVFSAVASGLVLFSAVEIVTVEYITMNLPAAAGEIVLGIWLIFKGFQYDGNQYGDLAK